MGNSYSLPLSQSGMQKDHSARPLSSQLKLPAAGGLSLIMFLQVPLLHLNGKSCGRMERGLELKGEERQVFSKAELFFLTLIKIPSM